MKRALVCLGLAVAAGLYYFTYQSGYQDGKSEMDAEIGKLEKQAVKANDGLQAQLQKEKEDALIQAREREVVLRRDADAAHDAVARLRVTLDRNKDRIISAPGPPSVEYAIALSDVLQECVSEYRQVAEKADGHANDAMMLQQAWPEIDQEPEQ